MAVPITDLSTFGALLGCKCPECEEDARQWAVLHLDTALNVVSSTSEGDDGAWCAPLLPANTTLIASVGPEAFDLLRPRLEAAIQGRAWSSVGFWSMHGMPETPFRMSIVPVFGVHGAIIGVQLLLKDAARTHLHRGRYLELQEKLAIVQQYAADGILSMDALGQIETVNVAAETMFGWTAAEMIGRPVTMLMPPDMAQRHPGYVSRFLKTGQSGILNVGPRTVKALRKDGVLFDMELSVAEASFANRTSFIGVCRSVPSQRATGNAQAASSGG